MTEASSAIESTSVAVVNWDEAKPILSHVRRTVFIEEQRVSEAEEWDERDARDDTTHFLLKTANHTIGAARMLANGQIGRMAILKEYRGKGYGLRLLKDIIERTLATQYKTGDALDIFLHAQTQAIPFYEKGGFKTSGEQFIDAGIPHKAMGLVVDRTFLETHYGDSVLRLSSADEFGQHLSQAASNASRTLQIFCRHLNPTLWGSHSVVNAISALARRSRNSKVHILIQDSSAIIGTSHPLITLTQRMSSRMTIRVLDKETTAQEHAYAITDQRQLLFFNNEEDLSGFMNYCAPGECRTLMDEFERMWRYSSHTDPNLAQIHI